MNKVILLIPFLLASAFSNAQRLEKKKMEFKYVQFPTTPVKGVSSYNSTLVIGYHSKINSLKTAYNQDQAQAEADYQSALLVYAADQKKADDQYAKDMETYRINEQMAEAEYQAALKIYMQGNGTNPNSGTIKKGGTNPTPNPGTGTIRKGGTTPTPNPNPNVGTGTIRKGGTTPTPNPNPGTGTIRKGGATPTPNPNPGTVQQDTAKKQKPVKRVVIKPRKRNVVMPQKRFVEPPYYPKLFDANSLADNYLKLEGMTDDPNNALQIIATLKGFDLRSRQVRGKKNSSKNKEGETITTMSYYGYVQYRHPVHVQVISPMGQTLMDEVIASSEKIRSRKTKEFSSRAAARQYLRQGTFLRSVEDKVMARNMKGIRKNLNNRFGFPIKKRTTFFRMYSHRKMNYPEYREAYESIVLGYKAIVDRNRRAEALGHINKAIAAWERAMRESDPNNKKARINKKVTRFTHLMLAEAYMWADNFAKAEEHISRMKTLKPIMKEKKWMTRLTRLLASQKQRITAYNKVQ